MAMMTRRLADIDRDLTHYATKISDHRRCEVWAGPECIRCPEGVVLHRRIDELLDERLRLGA